MDSREIVTVSEKCEVLNCSDKVKSFYDSSSPINAKHIFVSRNSATSEDKASLGPVTPDINGQCRDHLLKTPLSLPNRLDQLESVRDIGGDYESPHTPKEDVFDPFAPSCDNLLQAPQCEKRFDEWRTNIARHLNFGFSTDELKNGSCKWDGTCISDEEIVEAVYKNLLETILESKIEDLLAQSSLKCADEDCNTPTSRLKLNGVAETCPRAPRKAAVKSRNIDLSLCKKLQF